MTNFIRSRLCVLGILLVKRYIPSNWNITINKDGTKWKRNLSS